jgi:hypothetical protein
MYKFLLLAFMFVRFHLSAQTLNPGDSYIIKLSETSLALKDLSTDFKICYVIDGRKEKRSIGWVQTGLTKTTRIANFEKPLDKEITNLLDRSHILSDDTTAWIMLISKLTISEHPRAASEIAKAEVVIDFFKPFGGDSCHFVGSAFASFEHLGVDVTRRHADNIKKAFEKAITTFKISSLQSRHKKPYPLSALLSENFTTKDPSSLAILNDSHYPDGVFETFNDFLLNNPSVQKPFEPSIGRSIDLWRVDDNRKKRVTEGVVAFAKDNQLYYLFQQNFYRLEKKKGRFQFIGPNVFNRNKVGQASLGNFFGSAITASTSARRKVYQLDLVNGGIIEIGSVK